MGTESSYMAGQGNIAGGLGVYVRAPAARETCQCVFLSMVAQERYYGRVCTYWSLGFGLWE
jgi:hypothetical protein